VRIFRKKKQAFTGTLVTEIPEKYNTYDIKVCITRNAKRNEFSSKIDGVDKVRNEIIILAPMLGSEALELLKDDIIEITVISDSGINTWECAKVGERISNDVKLIVLQQVKDMTYKNRRASFRVIVNELFKYRIIKKDVDENFESLDESEGVEKRKGSVLEYINSNSNSNEIVEGILIDISIHGIKFKTDTQVEIGEQLEVYIKDKGYIVEIVRQVDIESKTEFCYGARFLDIHREIEKYVMELQIRNLKRRRANM